MISQARRIILGLTILLAVSGSVPVAADGISGAYIRQLGEAVPITAPANIERLVSAEGTR